MNGRLIELLTVLVLVPTAAASQDLFSNPVARVLKVKGMVRIQDQEGENRVADVYGVVRENEQLIVKADAEITLGFRLDGHMERLRGSFQAKVTKNKIAAPAAKIERIEPPRKHRRLVAGAVKKLKSLSREGTRLLRGPEGTTSPHEDEPASVGLEPINTSTVLSLRPTLSWPPVAGAVAYDVTLSHPDGLSIWTATTTQAALECAGVRRLQSGDQYVWEVTAKLRDHGSRRAYRGEFLVATDEQRNEVSQVEELIAESKIVYFILAASWYESNGFLAEAIAVCRRVAELEPMSASAHQALATLYDRAGRRQDAKNAWRQANRILSRQRGPARVRSIFDD